jgi:hypothetical protein
MPKWARNPAKFEIDTWNCSHAADTFYVAAHQPGLRIDRCFQGLTLTECSFAHQCVFRYHALPCDTRLRDGRQRSRCRSTGNERE